jgi:hypothetical protein
MARPSDNSLRYYNRDTKDDDNLLYVEAVHGLTGYALVDKLWKHIYGCPGGYYCEFAEINQRLFCKNNGVTMDVLWKVLETCFEPGIEIFSREMHQSHKILTSSGVQKRWLRIVKEAGRKNSSIKESFRIIEIEGINGSAVPVSTPGNHTAAIVYEPITDPETPQSKVKESKVEERKEIQGAPTAPAPDESVRKKSKRKEFISPTQLEIQKFFIETIGQRWGEAKSKMAADSCLDHYTANGWVQNKGKPIVDWKAACRNWIRREINGDFSKATPLQPAKLAPMPPPSAVSEKPTPPPPLTKKEADMRMKEFVNDLYSEFIEGTLRFEFLATNVYDYIKTIGLMKMSQPATDQIMVQAKEKRMAELSKSIAPADIKLFSLYQMQPDCDEVKNDKGFLKMAKRLALLEFFAQYQGRNDLFVFNLQTNANVE